MKKTTALLLCICLAGCATTTAYLSNPNTQNAILSLTNAVISYTSGNDVGAAVNLVQGGTLLVRSLESSPVTTTAPTPAALGAAAQQAMTLSGVSSKVAAATGAAVQTMATNGAAPNAALESAAGALMVASGVPDPSAPVQPATGPRGPAGRYAITGRTYSIAGRSMKFGRSGDERVAGRK